MTGRTGGVGRRAWGGVGLAVAACCLVISPAGGQPEAQGDMGFAGAGPADQNDVMRVIHELTAMQRPDSGFVDLAGGEVKAGEILVGREPRGLHVIGDRPHFPLGQFGLQKL